MTDSQIKTDLEGVSTNLLQEFPANMRGTIRDGMYFAGGCIVDQVLGDRPRDYDLFFKDEKIATMVREYFTTNRKNLSITVKALTTNAVTLNMEGTIVQAVTRFTGPPDRVFKDFDYEHTKCYYDPASGSLVYNRDIIANKKLVYTGEKDKYSLNTLKRLVKFTNRGWVVDNQSLIALHKSCAKNDLNNPEIMAELAPGFYGSSLV